jgi:hypothetical protein
MPHKMLFISVALLLTACGDASVNKGEAAAVKAPIVERSQVTDFDPNDTPQQQQDKAEARGAAQADAAIQGDNAAERERRK